VLRVVARKLESSVELVRSHPVAHPTLIAEVWRERTGGHAAAGSHAPHLAAALEWLERAQDATPDDGFARGYALNWHPYFRVKGWQPSYPETTGYIIPTLYRAAYRFDRSDLAERATRAAHWESDLQLESGAVQGGVVGQAVSPAIFNTGQVLLGWLAALDETAETRFEDSARRAAAWLASITEADGRMRHGNSRFARSDATLYNARVAWALAEAGLRFREPSWTDAAARALDHVAARQYANGWFPDCCLHDPNNPLLHTLAYTARGLLEGGRVLEDGHLIDAAARTAGALARAVDSEGRMSGRFDDEWRPAVDWSCLTGQAQTAVIWLRLHEITGERPWLEPVPGVLRFLERTQNLTSRDPGLRGGIKGSWPVGGRYGRYELLNWATKFFVDALMLYEEAQASVPVAGRREVRLA